MRRFALTWGFILKRGALSPVSGMLAIRLGS